MITNIKVRGNIFLNNFDKTINDLVIGISLDGHTKVDLNVNFEVADLSYSPAELKELNINKFKYSNKAPIANFIKEMADRPEAYTLYVISEFPDMEAMGLAIAISESIIFKGQFTSNLLKQASLDLDLNCIVEYLNLASELRSYIKSKFDCSDTTQYSIFDKISTIETLDFIINKAAHTKKYKRLNIDINSILEHENNEIFQENV